MAHQEELDRSEEAATADPGPTRSEARKHIEKRRSLQSGLVAYVVVNAGLIAIWAMTGGGYFWPGWVMALWAVGMVLGFWDYLRRPVTAADVDTELRRMQSER